MQRFDPEGKKEEAFEFFFRDWEAEKVKPGDTLPVDNSPYVVVDVQRDVEDPKFSSPVTVIQVKKVANQ